MAQSDSPIHALVKSGGMFDRAKQFLVDQQRLAVIAFAHRRVDVEVIQFNVQQEPLGSCEVFQLEPLAPGEPI